VIILLLVWANYLLIEARASPVGKKFTSVRTAVWIDQIAYSLDKGLGRYQVATAISHSKLTGPRVYVAYDLFVVTLRQLFAH
jgi:hypothetical protein